MSIKGLLPTRRCALYLKEIALEPDEPLFKISFQAWLN